MSKRVEAEITCPSCGDAFPVNLYRSIWVEDPKNMSLVRQGRVNWVECPGCRSSGMLPFAFLATNAPKQYAVWWEPEFDEDVERDAQQYARHMGADSYFAKAPRIRDYEEFLSVLEDFESGRRRGGNAPSPGALLSGLAEARSNAKSAGPGASNRKGLAILLVAFVVVVFLVLASMD